MRVELNIVGGVKSEVGKRTEKLDSDKRNN